MQKSLTYLFPSCSLGFLKTGKLFTLYLATFKKMDMYHKLFQSEISLTFDVTTQNIRHSFIINVKDIC